MAQSAEAASISRFSRTSHRHIKQGFFSRTLPFWLLLPTLLVLIAIQFIPGVFSFFLSTQSFERGQQTFVGLRNFERVFTSSAFGESLWHTLFFLIGYVTLTLIAGFVIAQILNRKLRLSAFYITVIFIPWVLSDVVVGLIFRLFVVPDYGLFSALFANPNIFPPKGISILTTPPSTPILPDVPFPPAPALIYLIFASAWKALPFITLLILAALQTVPREVIESAAIDGADGWRTVRFITFPLILPTLVVALFNLTLSGVNGVGMVFSLTGGGPGTATEVLSYLLYTIGFGRLDFGRAAALSVFMAIINLTLILLALRISRSEREA
ncbi:MAG: sugar ABC transporter permease [Anaerolineae bacterium]|nr:sugar ABC transporter permease [Thermoflexales bacterium]MDW8407770.1 sugar ABC transporter permease [Anaerolineae bacterium]